MQWPHLKRPGGAGTGGCPGECLCLFQFGSLSPRLRIRSTGWACYSIIKINPILFCFGLLLFVKASEQMVRFSNLLFWYLANIQAPPRPPLAVGIRPHCKLLLFFNSCFVTLASAVTHIHCGNLAPPAAYYYALCSVNVPHPTVRPTNYQTTSQNILTHDTNIYYSASH